MNRLRQRLLHGDRPSLYHFAHSLFAEAEQPKTKSIENWDIGRQKILGLLIKMRDFSR
jgi:hypothetical protein